jgi:hypothetical protein
VHPPNQNALQIEEPSNDSWQWFGFTHTTQLSHAEYIKMAEDIMNKDIF